MGECWPAFAISTSWPPGPPGSATGNPVGSIAIYCAHEAVADAGLDLDDRDKSGWVSTWASPSMATLRPRTRFRDLPVRLRHQRLVTPPQPTDLWRKSGRRSDVEPGDHRSTSDLGSRLAAGNAGVHPGCTDVEARRRRHGTVGGVSESIHTFGIFASFKSQGALASHQDPTKACRPFDIDRNGIVVAEGGAV
ncbi:MAG: hypothetical protein Ct9H300mP1_21930 [Planctomycetaceae bacterium]|nr:MAG: hypothetical protein Ct9H300mP1_21930 [Planctomycetaceae bacterium]